MLTRLMALAIGLILSSCLGMESSKTTDVNATSRLLQPLVPGLKRIIPVSDTLAVVFTHPFATYECQDSNVKDTLWNAIGLLTRQGYALVDSSQYLFVLPGHGEVSPARDAYGFFYCWVPNDTSTDSLRLLRGHPINSSKGVVRVSFIDLQRRTWGLYFSRELIQMADNEAEDFNSDGSVKSSSGNSYFLLSKLIDQDINWMHIHQKAMPPARINKYRELATDSIGMGKYSLGVRQLLAQCDSYSPKRAAQKK